MDWKHIVWITLLVISATFSLRASAVEITFIDAGEGEAMLLESEGETALIDSGNLISGGDISEFLKAKGLESLDVVIITHPHLDHLGGIFQVLSKFNIKQRFDNGQDPNPDSDLYRWYRDAYRNFNYQALSTGESLVLGNANILVLNAVRPNRTNLNQNSLVLMVSHGDSRALLMADADASVEAGLIAQGAALNADVLKVGHHGYSDATTAEFLEKVAPSAAVICINEDNHRGYPSSEVLDRLKEHSIEVITTYQEGHISFKSDGRRFYRTAPD